MPRPVACSAFSLTRGVRRSRTTLANSGLPRWSALLSFEPKGSAGVALISRFSAFSAVCLDLMALLIESDPFGPRGSTLALWPFFWCLLGVRLVELSSACRRRPQMGLRSSCHLSDRPLYTALSCRNKCGAPRTLSGPCLCFCAPIRLESCSLQTCRVGCRPSGHRPGFRHLWRLYRWSLCRC